MGDRTYCKLFRNGVDADGNFCREAKRCSCRRDYDAEKHILDLPVLRGKETMGKLLLSEAEAARVASMAVEGISMLQIAPVVRAEDNGTSTLLHFELITPFAEPKTPVRED